ncbi:UvrD-helicase domain-containing protein [candidate division KSB1 bacterium]|nr:UvrD-helicase domain-containing protein [candidate division KSB1 bacterium]MBL7094272.1 UvrD-helicase domain-containing protein [candidate division KSB1 bacterium]
MSLLKNLNSVQKQSVENTEGPNLILAGAGSGKTRVLTHKIAYLIERKKVKPENILAMTFTNKAANEMKERIFHLLKNQVNSLWIGTFHSIFARILRKNCEKIGYRGNFVIYDEADQRSIIKTVINELDFDVDDSLKPNSIKSKIKFVKNSNKTLEDLQLSGAIFRDEIFEVIYNSYQKHLIKNNAMDFEDLLLKSMDLFRLFPSVAEYYQNIFKYILVDEYQDTNRLQYELIKTLGGKNRNISVVGDDDQSIYRWRGADIRNILDFEKDYPECNIFRLEQNYRSNENILKIAHSIIRHNASRMEKELWTKNEAGEKVSLIITSNAGNEANYIVQKIIEETQKNQRNFTDFAILYRTNAQSRYFEEVLNNNGISYVVVGGIRFYERKEIKDVLAYLRVLINQNDSVSLKRIINYPARNIGEATVAKIEKYCSQNNLSLFDGLKEINKIEKIQNKKKLIISDFYKLLKKYIDLKDTISFSELIKYLIEDLGIRRLLKEEGTVESLNRLENIGELINGIDEFLKNHPDQSLEHYLENVALITDVDNWDRSANVVSLLTLHSAKGLEFPVVFVTGLEEGLFPLTRQMENEESLEEERRLFYVGATRAKEKLYLTSAKYRRQYGETTQGNISRFLTEIDRDYLDFEDLSYQKSSYEKNHRPKQKRTYKFSNSIAAKETSNNEFEQGMLVRHERFGKGVVNKVYKDGDDIKLNVLFSEVGQKKIMLKYCKLEKLS